MILDEIVTARRTDVVQAKRDRRAVLERRRSCGAALRSPPPCGRGGRR
jgi:hypothetical protein